MFGLVPCLASVCYLKTAKARLSHRCSFVQHTQKHTKTNALAQIFKEHGCIYTVSVFTNICMLAYLTLCVKKLYRDHTK